MLTISQDDVKRRIERDNLWWADQPKVIPEALSPKRVYFASFREMALDFSVKRATVLLGPRRVGKTYMIKQLIHEAIVSGVDPKCILFASVDTPFYSGISLEQFLSFLPSSDPTQKQLVIFDEIQYLRDWERHLKDLVDAYPNTKFVATGSAAAALKLKSRESGAGRFSDFMLPPLTFYEFLLFLAEDDNLIDVSKTDVYVYSPKDINKLNSFFIDYLNFGGYPEAVLNEKVRANSEQFIRNDIVDRVLLNDLPSLYGIQDITELKRLFSFLAYNAGAEASYENISQGSGISKPTIKRYMEYLESAFLIIKIQNVDDNCRTLQRERNFKIYLNNPSMRAALFGPVEHTDTQRIGFLAECAVFSQWQHALRFGDLRYGRWKNEGEVDIVLLDSATQKPLWIGEIKWSDRISEHKTEVTRHLWTMLEKHKKHIQSAFITTKTAQGRTQVNLKWVNVIPTALYCYTVGRNVTLGLSRPPTNPEDTSADVTSDEKILAAE